MKIEINNEERWDLFQAILTRIHQIEEMLKIPAFKDSKAYKNESARMINLKDKFKYNG